MKQKMKPGKYMIVATIWQSVKIATTGWAMDYFYQEKQKIMETLERLKKGK